MKTIYRIATLFGMLTLSSTAFALTLGPDDADWQGSEPGNPDAYDVQCIVAGATFDGPPPPTGDFNGWTTDCGGDLTELYKQDVGGPESGPFADDYTTTFSNTESDPEDATIVWGEGDKIVCTEEDPCYLLVKDGSQDPIWYLFDISDWDGMETIHLEGFWPDQGAISHVSIYGGGGTTDMPEPGTIALLGLGLLGLGLTRRRRIR